MSEQRMNRRIWRLPGRQEGEERLSGLLKWAESTGVDPRDVVVSGGHLIWSSPETAEEKRLREQREADTAERVLAGRRKVTLEYIREFGIPTEDSE